MNFFTRKLSRQKLLIARDAMGRCHHVPYARDLSGQEISGMLLLERHGLATRDEGFAGLHWHLTEDGREWLMERR